MRILVVVVTYKSSHVIQQTLTAVFSQLRPQDSLVIVNNGDTVIPDYAPNMLSFSFVKHDSVHNLGFCGGNNLGLRLGSWADFDAVLLLNPDLVLPNNWLNTAVKYLTNHATTDIGILSGPLISYDFSNNQPLSRIDSLGIGRQGLRWQDLQQGQAFDGNIDTLIFSHHPEAICGALMLLPRTAIEAVIENGQLFDEKFSSYKEDIDLCLRLRNMGKKLILEKSLLAYHGRGWSTDRRAVPYHLRLQSARNEVLLHWKNHKRYLFISILKWCYVRWVEKK